MGWLKERSCRLLRMDHERSFFNPTHQLSPHLNTQVNNVKERFHSVSGACTSRRCFFPLLRVLLLALVFVACEYSNDMIIMMKRGQTDTTNGIRSVGRLDCGSATGCRVHARLVSVRPRWTLCEQTECWCFSGSVLGYVVHLCLSRFRGNRPLSVQISIGNRSGWRLIDNHHRHK